MTLNNGKTGAVYTVDSIDLDRKVFLRLEALGLTKGTNIRILNRSRTGSVILNVRGSRLALGNMLTEKIEIREVSG